MPLVARFPDSCVCHKGCPGWAQLDLSPLILSTLPAGPGRPGVLPPAIQRGVLPPADPVLPAVRQPRVQGDQGVLHQPELAALRATAWHCPGKEQPRQRSQAGLRAGVSRGNLAEGSFFFCLVFV